LLVTRVPRGQRSQFPATAGKQLFGPFFNVDVIAFYSLAHRLNFDPAQALTGLPNDPGSARFSSC
jgi:hypothetical protein